MLYESYIRPLTILSTLPSAGVGALLMLMVVGFEFRVIALVGVIRRDRQEERHHDGGLRHPAVTRPGLSALDAIREACLLRSRPIMMTTMAALPARVPLMLDNGTGSVRQPLGFAMVGGLMLSQVLTLYTAPVVFLYLDRLNTWPGHEPPGSSHRNRCPSR